MRVLCVAEKPSIAKAISQILSGGRFMSRPSQNKYIKNYDFDYPKTNSFFTVTSVSGHLMEHDFDGPYNSWESCDPFVLFDAPIVAKVTQDNKTVEKNLIDEARRSDMLMIWTDCDREGEHIGAEIVKVCRKARANITVKRARFSAIIPQQIHRAAQNPIELDIAQAAAVEARILLDLRIGAAFTRMQTLALRSRFQKIKEQKGSVSYGPCQFPTLGFVVSQYKLVEAFVPESFWHIYLSLNRGGQNTEFIWNRGRVFEYNHAAELYENVLGDPIARVMRVTKKAVKKWKPYPLTTVEFQKAASRLLRLAPKKALDIAEKLYQQGFLSYPRTETDQFDPQFDLMSLIAKQTADPTWGNFATSLQGDAFGAPRQGKKNDQAHPPIHPTAHMANLVGDEKKVYEYITRRFLACCAKDAEGWETQVEIMCGGDAFHASGLVVKARNYLDVYPYDNWVSKSIPDFTEGEQFEPSVCELKEGRTTSPSTLTEADLVGLMDRNGIGTDATIATHIQVVVDRGYVIERMEGGTKHLVPSTLGIGLVDGYNDIGFEKSLSKPHLRSETERSMVQVCEGDKSQNDMLIEAIEQYKDIFIKARRNFEKVVSSVQRHLETDAHVSDGDGDNSDPDNGRNGGGPGRGSRGGRGGRGGRGRRGTPGRGRPPRVTKNSCEPKAKPPKEPAAAGNGIIPVANVDPFQPNNDPPANPVSSSRVEQPPTRPIVPSSSTANETQRFNQPTSSINETSSRKCLCGLAAVQRTVIKKGPNQGRYFWSCPNAEKGCQYFDWDRGSNSGTAGDATQESNMCFKCRQQGHWANACPENSAAEEPTQARSFGSRTENVTRTSQFRNSCPSEVGTQNKASGTTSKDTCFKCHQEGHWSKDCPNNGEPGSYLKNSKKLEAENSERKRGANTSKRGRKPTFGAADGR